jgi:hypothetical protein
MNNSTHIIDEKLPQLKDLLRGLLLSWQSGELDERAVHEEADALWTEKEWPQYSHDDPRSIIVEVLEQLSILNNQWIISEDVPAILSFLDTPPCDEEQGWGKWQKYWGTLDWKKRWGAIKDNPYYSQRGPQTESGDSRDAF